MLSDIPIVDLALFFGLLDAACEFPERRIHYQLVIHSPIILTITLFFLWPSNSAYNITTDILSLLNDIDKQVYKFNGGIDIYAKNKARAEIVG